MVSQSLIDDFLEKEKNRGPRIFRMFPLLQVFESTSSLCEDLQVSKQKDSVTIRPSILKRILTMPFILFGFWFGYVLIKTMLTSEFPVLLIILFFSLLLIILFISIYFPFVNRKMNYKIILNNERIHLAEKKISWSSIQDTFIYTVPGGRGDSRYLVIVTNDNIFQKFDLFNFGITDTKLSSYIEYYKPKKQNP